MAILATLPGINLFSSLPSKTPKHEPNSSSSSFSRSQLAVATPIPIPKYPPPLRKSRIPPPKRSDSESESESRNPAFKTTHRRTKYYKPVKDGVISSDGDRSVIIGESGVSYLLPGAPFEFQYSYSETPKVKPLATREPAFLPFAPPTMPRPWTGKAPMKKSKKKTPLLYSDEPESRGVRRVEMVRANSLVKCVDTRTRKEILGEPLKKMEIRMLVQPYLGRNRQVNLGRDGLTHNMLELVHSHWRRQAVCKVRCKGVPTIDMDNICHHLEEKTGGKIIHRVGGTVYLFRGRNYNYNTRPQYPVMLWKPAAPVYPKLIQDAPEGLTKAEADQMRKKAKKLLPICKLAKNGVYTSLVKDVRNAFESSPLVKIDCEGMHATDYKKLGAKLKELVPCVLISFDDEQILMWRGSDWKSMYRDALPPNFLVGSSDLEKESGDANDDQLTRETKPICSSPKMTALWNNAITSNKALLLDTINLGPDALLQKVEEFEGISQATVYSYPALIVSSQDRNSYASDDKDDTYGDEDDEEYLSDTYEEGDLSVPPGSLPVDKVIERINRNKNRYS